MFGNDNQDDGTQLSGNPTGASTGSSAGDISSFNMGKPPLLSKTDASPLEPTTAPTTDQTTTADESSVIDSAPVVASDAPDSAAAPDLPTNDSSDSAAPADDNQDLMGIKQQALSQLSPIVTHLDQSPEEKFKTLMMMIQASDNQSLIKEAYAAAEQITDETAKAQALLDVVNEINYFTQNKEEK